jgi:hypothetical protein
VRDYELLEATDENIISKEKICLQIVTLHFLGCPVRPCTVIWQLIVVGLMDLCYNQGRPNTSGFVGLPKGGIYK